MKFKGDMIITDPCYIIPEGSDDWDSLADCGISMELVLKTDNFLCRDTRIGDWSETVYPPHDKTNMPRKVYCD